MRRSLLVLLALATAAPLITAMAAPPRVRIVAPKRNATVRGESVTVRFKAEGIAIVPATGLKEEGKAHHHLFVDADLTPADSVIPKTPQIHHLGNGADSLVLTGLAPGRHRLIAVMAWGTHVPVAGARTDTITITVTP